MDSSLNDKVAIDLPKSVGLVLFELLTRSYEVWRKENPDDGSADPMVVEAREFAQRRALWRLEGALERSLPVLFSMVKFPVTYRELSNRCRPFVI